MAENKTARLTIDGQQAKSTLNDLQKEASKVRNILRNLDPELDKDKVAKYRSEYEKINGTINGTKQQLGLMKQEGVNAVNVFKQFNPIQGQMDALGGKFTEVRGGVGGLIKNLGLLRTAFAATGIGAIVIALGALYVWLTKSQAGMELVEKVTKSAGAAFNVLTDRFIILGDAIASFFKGNFEEGFDKLGQSVKGVTEEIRDETMAMWELVEASQQLTKDENDFIVTVARRKNEIARLILLTRQETASFEEKEKALQRANDLEMMNLDDQIKLQRQKIGLMLDEKNISDERIQQLKDEGIELENVGMANSIEEDRKKVLQEVANLIRLETDSMNRQRELKNRMIELENKRLAAVKAQNAELAKQLEIEQETVAFKKLQEESKGLEMLDPADDPEILQQQALGEIALENLKTLEEQKAVIEEESKKRRLEAEKVFYEAREQFQKDAFKNSQDFLMGTIGLLKEETDARKQFGIALKSLKIAEIAVSLQKEIQAIWETANANPANILFPGAGSAIAVLKTAGAIGRATIATATIAKTKFAEGGELKGASHAAGGIPFTIGGMGGFEAEGGEFLVNKAATQLYKPLLETLNKSVKFASGGEIPVMQPQFSTPSNTAITNTNNDLLVMELRALREDFSTLERERKTVLVYSDLETFGSEVAQIRNY